MSKRKKWLLLFSAALIMAALTLWIIWGNSALTVSEFNISGSGIPEAFFGFRIAQVSDLHNARFGEDNEKLISALDEASPDVIFITGDFADSRRTDIDVCVSFAEQALDIAPVYYVTGNHEARITEYVELKTALECTGVTVLENERTVLEKDDGTVTLLGIDDPSFTTDYLSGDSVSVVKNVLDDLVTEDNGYTILLSHRPELFDVYVEIGVDLIFSGHAHGGQIRLPFVGGLAAPNQGLFPKYDAGLFTEGNTNMVVSRGLGNSLFPFRVNNRPEIVVVQFTSE